MSQVKFFVSNVIALDAEVDFVLDSTFAGSTYMNSCHCFFSVKSIIISMNMVFHELLIIPQINRIRKVC